MSRSNKVDLTPVRQFLDSVDNDTIKEVFKLINQQIQKRKITKRAKKARLRRKSGSVADDALTDLLSEDWSSLFQQYESESTSFCVYMHGDPKVKCIAKPCFEGRHFANPVYVGMGDSLRPYNFLRTPMHSKYLADAVSQGFTREQIVAVVASGLSERAAREMEAKLILYYGVSTAKGDNRSRHRAFGSAKRTLFNAKYEPMPDDWKEYV